MLGAAIDVGSQIKHVRMAFGRRKNGADRRAVNPRQHLEDEAGNGHQRPGVASRNRSLRVAGLDEINRHAHRGILLAAHGQGWRLVHADDLRRTLNAQPLAELGTRRAQVRLTRLRTPYEHNPGITVGPQEMQSSRNGYRRAVIAPHAVNSQGDSHSAQSEKEFCRIVVKTARSPEGVAPFLTRENYSPLALATFLPR